MVKTKRVNRLISLQVFGGGLSFLTFLSCFTIGFSSWSFGTNSNDSVSVNANIGDVEDGTFFEIGNISMFTIGQYGLVDNDKFVDKSTFSIDIIIHNDEIYNEGYLVNDGTSYNLSFVIILGCNKASFISTYITNDPKIDGASKITKVTTTDESFKHSINYSINDVSENSRTKISIIYDIKDNTNNAIKTYYGDTPLFSFKVGVEE